MGLISSDLLFLYITYDALFEFHSGTDVNMCVEAQSYCGSRIEFFAESGVSKQLCKEILPYPYESGATVRNQFDMISE